MQLKRECLVILLVLSFSLTIIAYNVYAISAGSGTFAPLEPGAQVFNPSEVTQINPANNIFSPGEGVSSISNIGEGMSVQTSSGLLSNIASSYNVLMKSGQIVEGVIISSKNGNSVQALNLLDGSLIVYNMQLGDKVVIDQIGGDGIMGNEYNAKMDKGVSADVSKDLGKIRFTA
ncbi:MAG: hypothetical protein Q8O03_08985 [Nanoarchaeota archaeon]|nr:hypothetical protein [Nanoarchaeota archaeon]